MSLNIFYEDGRGNTVDEHGNDPMNMEEVVVTEPNIDQPSDIQRKNDTSKN
jgi:hypothetical protein